MKEKDVKWLESMLDGFPFKFWRCPDHRGALVEWDGDIAICQTCGKTNKETEKMNNIKEKTLPWVLKEQMLEYCLVFAEGKAPNTEDVNELFNTFCKRVRSEIKESDWVQEHQNFRAKGWSTAKEIQEMTEIILFIENAGRIYGKFFELFCSTKTRQWMSANYPQLSNPDKATFFLEQGYSYRHNHISADSFVKSVSHLFKEEELWEAYEESIHCAAETYKCAIEMEAE